MPSDGDGGGGGDGGNGRGRRLAREVGRSARLQRLGRARGASEHEEADARRDRHGNERRAMISKKRLEAHVGNRRSRSHATTGALDERAYF